MTESANFPIVGVGASAGGIESLEGFFSGMPENPGVGIVIVTHLNPERESVLHEIVARYTHLPVHLAEDGVRVEPNSVHVLPADAILSIKDGRLAIRKHEPSQRERKPIDIFLASLAKDVGEYAVSIVLSGGDGDGTLGTKAVKERGGLTMAQLPDGYGPSHPDMPESAISTGLVDFAVPVHEMGRKLADHARSFAPLEAMAAGKGGQSEGMTLEEGLQAIYALLRNQLGHDFGGYKSKTFLRRVQRRMQVTQMRALDAYVRHLQADPKEVAALFRDLLINVTNFFRDAESFEKLAELAIPKLFEGRNATDTIRVWVPGCSTGEEVFSLAMLMREHMDTLKAVPRVSIFATDIDEVALGVARAGRYPEGLLDTVSEERCKRFFIQDGGSYVIAKEVREMCIFSPHSVIRDPPFSRMDLVSCRNLLIYFGADVQAQVIPTFHYSLKPGGFLFLGGSENVSQFGDLFTPLDKKHRIFRARESVGAPPRFPLSSVGPHSTSLSPGHSPPRSLMGALALRQVVEQQVLERFAPPHVVTNREGEIVYYSARTGKYLEPPAGAPSRQLLSLARRGLRLDLRAVFREAIERNDTVTRQHVTLEEEDGRVQLLTLTVEPVQQGGEGAPLMMVLFADEGAPLSREDATARADARRTGVTEQLERELRDTRERLQSLIEEYETALEELKSSNEELVSVNEELQSTNEELEASKEELQSLNEELHTVNQELHGKVEDLDRTNADLQNLFESTRVGTIFLDRAMVIRSFNPSVGEVFNILPSDRGRPITDLSSRLIMPELGADIRLVLDGGASIERRVANASGDAHFLVRVAPYLDGDKKPQGVVATFANITAVATAEAHQRVLIDELNHRVKNMLMVAISMLEQTSKNTDSVHFREVFSGRLHAMARSYQLLSQENWTDVSIGELLRQEVAPFGLERVEFAGTDVQLKPRRALSLGMILHELVTNAAKYGALSNSHGRVVVAWKTDQEDLHLSWVEQGGPEVATPTHRGLGMKLVEREAVAGLAGGSKIPFEPAGLQVDLRINLSNDPGARE